MVDCLWQRKEHQGWKGFSVMGEGQQSFGCIRSLALEMACSPGVSLAVEEQI